MDWGIILAVVMLVIWAIGTVLQWAGWIHALLTAGVFLLIFSVVKRGGKAGAQ
ncbi:MAG TPA: DUF5670 family protein [Gemmatimonadaceae bacterium]|nr:DUF5670 family protein [Gemmatimonadaceae bacterium]